MSVYYAIGNQLKIDDPSVRTVVLVLPFKPDQAFLPFKTNGRICFRSVIEPHWMRDSISNWVIEEEMVLSSISYSIHHWPHAI